MQLTKDIAEQIVSRAVKIIKNPINVMDQQGIIIASADKSRIYTMHEGALLALNENRVVEIDLATSKKLRGVKPGINLPIIFHYEIIGIIGISGEPDAVRHYGELVKMAAELILEQADLITDIQWNKRHHESLILQLVRSTDLTEPQLHSITQRLDIDPLQPRIASIVKVYSANGTDISLKHLQRLVHLLEFPERDNLVAVASVSNSEVLVLKPISLEKNGWSKEKEQKRVEKLLKRINDEALFSVRIALGDYFPTLKGLQKSFISAKATLESTSQNAQISFYQDHILSVLLYGLKADDWRFRQLQAPLKLLLNADSKGVLVKTLTSFFENNCDMAKTSQALYIHRNTLRYRMEKIARITSLDTSNMNDKTRIYLAILTTNSANAQKKPVKQL